MAKPLHVLVYAEDLYWLRSTVREQVRSNQPNEHSAPKANRMYALLNDLCDDYMESDFDRVQVRITIRERTDA